MSEWPFGDLKPMAYDLVYATPPYRLRARRCSCMPN